MGTDGYTEDTDGHRWLQPYRKPLMGTGGYRKPPMGPVGCREPYMSGDGYREPQMGRDGCRQPQISTDGYRRQMGTDGRRTKRTDAWMSARKPLILALYLSLNLVAE